MKYMLLLVIGSNLVSNNTAWFLAAVWKFVLDYFLVWLLLIWHILSLGCFLFIFNSSYVIHVCFLTFIDRMGAGTINNIHFLIPDKNNITFTDLTLEDHLCIQCNASNYYGYVFADVFLYVLGELSATRWSVTMDMEWTWTSYPCQETRYILKQVNFNSKIRTLWILLAANCSI